MRFGAFAWTGCSLALSLSRQAGEAQQREASELWTQTLGMMTRVLGEVASPNPHAWVYLASAFFCRGAPDCARRLPSVARMRRCAQEHVDTLTTAVHVGTSELQSGKHAEAAERLCVALPRLQRLVGEDAPVAIAAAANLAQALWQSGKPAEAADVYAGVLRVEMRVKGAQHADTAATADELSRCLQLVADG